MTVRAVSRQASSAELIARNRVREVDMDGLFRKVDVTDG
jgi:hypothetical protein